MRKMSYQNLEKARALKVAEGQAADRVLQYSTMALWIVAALPLVVPATKRRARKEHQS